LVATCAEFRAEILQQQVNEIDKNGIPQICNPSLNITRWGLGRLFPTA